MAKCKVCKTNIPDGTEICADCQNKKSSTANESYLDSLLNSVKNTTPSIESIYKKKNNGESDNDSTKVNKAANPQTGGQKMPESELEDYISYKVDLGDITDFDQFYMDDDLKDISDDLEINDEKLFGKDISDLLSDQPYKSQVSADKPAANRASIPNSSRAEVMNSEQQPKEQETYRQPVEEAPEDPGIFASDDITTADEVQPEEMLFPDEDLEKADSDDEFQNEEVYFSDDNLVEQAEEEDIPEYSQDNNFNPGEIAEFETEDDFDSDLNALLNSLDTYQSTDSKPSSEDEPEEAMEMEFEPAGDEFEQIEQEEDDFLALLNQISSDDPVAGDVKAINDLLSTSETKTSSASRTPSDVGEVFSDALKVVSSLNDANEDAILNMIPDSPKKNDKKKKDKKVKDSKKKAKKGSESDSDSTPKVGFFKALFGNVKDENSAAAKKKPKGDKTSEDVLTGEKDTGKKGKTKKPKKGAPAPTEEEVEVGKGGKGKPAEGKESKKEKKEKKKKSKEIIQVIDEIEEDEGRINRLGATIVFIFFGLLTALLLVGTNMVSYTLSIQNATSYFDRQKYTEAYNEVYGMDINDEDIEIYDKIMTVMFVNKQLNSYNSYYSLGMYPEALDSLLKGLKRYDKYIELATMLGIKTDLDYVRSQILAELKNVFKLSEEDAIRINSYPDSKEYSLEVYNAVLENMSY